LRFRGDSPGARLLVEQLLDFPNNDHDDGSDALKMAVRRARETLAEGSTEEVLGTSPTC